MRQSLGLNTYVEVIASTVQSKSVISIGKYLSTLLLFLTTSQATKKLQIGLLQPFMAGSCGDTVLQQQLHFSGQRH